jgi:hypothetical protein
MTVVIRVALTMDFRYPSLNPFKRIEGYVLKWCSLTRLLARHGEGRCKEKRSVNGN